MNEDRERIPWEVVIRRKNGRWVKSIRAGYSQYAAKQKARTLEEKYNPVQYYMEVQEIPPPWR